MEYLLKRMYGGEDNLSNSNSDKEDDLYDKKYDYNIKDELEIKRD